MGQMSRLDAVNQCLLAAGEAIVSDLENQSGVDTSIAEYLLDQYTEDYQLRGLANNVYTATLEVDSTTNKIYLPTNIMSLDFGTFITNSDGYTIRVSVKTDGSSFILWNVTDQTSDWSEYSGHDLKAALTVKLPWADIDTPGQRAITASAARRYQMLTQGDEGMDAYLQQDEMIYNAMGKARDIESKGRTIWDAADYKAKRAVFRQSGGNPNFRSWRGRTS
jgi:hypothetical protein